MTPDRNRILRADAADLVCTEPMDGSDGVILETQHVYAESSDECVNPDWRRTATHTDAPYDGTGRLNSWPDWGRAAYLTHRL